MFCRRPPELVLIPCLALLSICLNCLTLTQERWLTAYTDYGLIFATISPCYVCALDCPGCYDVKEYGKGYDISKIVKNSGKFYENESNFGNDQKNLDFICFWMSDWDSTGFDTLSIVQHLQYWSIGTTIMAVMLSLLTCIDRKGRLCCSAEFSKPALMLLIIAATLSVSVICLFSTAELSGLKGLLPIFTEKAGDLLSLPKDIPTNKYITLEWPFYINICSAVIIALAVIVGLLYETRTKSNDVMDPYIEDDKDITVLALDTDDVEEYQDLL